MLDNNQNNNIHSERHLNKHGRHALIGLLIILLLVCTAGYVKTQQRSPSQPKQSELAVHRVTHHYPYVNYKNNFATHVNQPSNFKFHTKASEALVMDEQNGNILYQKNINQPRRIASVGKLMTLYLAYRKASQNHAWNQRVKVSKNLAKMGDSKVLGGFKFKKNHHYTVKELYEAALIESSNNAAIALGEWVGGNNATFIKMMNAQAHVWHINAHFVSASGLENDDLEPYHLIVSGGRKGANMISAKAVAIIAQHLLKAYPKIVNLSKLPQKTVDNQQLNNMNGNLRGRSCPTKGVDGLKTGYTKSAGLTFCSTAKRKGHRIITVILNDPTIAKDNQRLVNKTYRAFGSTI